MRFLSDLQFRILQSLDLVFGDIGTSPIYTIGVILLFILPVPANILGILSLIIWTLFLVITVQYTWLAMHISSKGEGGTIVLKEVLLSLLKPGSRLIPVISVLTILGIALFIGDSVITPAISILSAVEGIHLIPGFEQTGGGLILLIAVIIATALFFIQRQGTEKVAFLFGPVMLLWFVPLSVTGVIAIISYPQILLALSPTYAFAFLFENGLTSVFVMSAVILSVTGGEALYADMGHLGCEPIVKGWYCIFPALVLSYLGQGAFVLQHPETHNVLISMFNHQLPFLYIPFLLLSLCATVIASQAMISGPHRCRYGVLPLVVPEDSPRGLLVVHYGSDPASHHRRLHPGTEKTPCDPETGGYRIIPPALCSRVPVPPQNQGDRLVFHG